MANVKTIGNVMWDDLSLDDNSDTLADTLRGLSSRPDFLVRKTEPMDVPAIVKLINNDTKKLFQSCDAGRYYETSVFSIVLFDARKPKNLAAHASFSDTPQDPEVNVDGKLWKTNEDLKGLTSLNTLFLSFFVIVNDFTPDTLIQELLGYTFLSCSLVENVVVELPSEEKYNGDLATSAFCREATLITKHKAERKFLVFEKNIMYPKLKIREGREHDLDDLSPLIDLDTADMEENFSKSYLNDLIAMSDRNNQSVVAEHKSIAVGMIAVTTDINYALLNNFFQLEPFHGLYKPHLRDEINLAYRKTDTEYRVCKADHKKYVKDDYEESLEGSDKNSRVGMASASSSSYTTTTTTTNTTRTTKTTDSRSTGTDASRTPGQVFSQGSTHVDHADGKAQIPRAGGTDTIIPMVPSKDDVANDMGEDIPRRAKPTPSEDLSQFPPEVLALHEQLRTGDLALDDLEELDDDIKEMLSKLEQIMAKQEDEMHVPSHTHHQSSQAFSDAVCYPMEILAERRPIYHGIPNALAIQLCVIDKKFHIRILDLIQGAFLCFPNREYCMITIPYGAPTPAWLEYFVRVVPRRQSLYDRELYVLHRNVFSCRLRIRPGSDRDAQKVNKLLETLHSKDKILADFARANMANACGNTCGLYSFVAIAGPPQQSHIIGLVILSDYERTEHYQVNYNTDSFVYFDLHEPKDIAYVHHFILNPIFRHFSKKILKEVMRHLKKQIFFHCVYSPYKETAKANHQTLLNNLEDWYLVPPRPRMNYQKLGLTDANDEDRVPPLEALDYSEPHALLLHARKLTYDVKVEVTSRIVFVGASITALSCLEKLISSPRIAFLHLTLISPHGVPGSLKPDEVRALMFPKHAGPSLSMESEGEWYDRTGIHLKVNVIFGSVTSFIREQKVVIVNRKEIVPYDHLVVTIGQQFVRPDCTEVEIQDFHLNDFIVRSVQQDDNKRQKAKKPLRRQTKKPKNVFVINTELDAAMALNYVRTQLPLFKRQRILIHGACLEAYCCLNALLRMGVNPERIVFIIRPTFHMDWEERVAYRDTPKLREVMLHTLQSHRIKVLPNHDFFDWFLDVRTNTVTRVNLIAPEESDSVSFSCFAYFGYSQHRISDEFLSALLECYVTFDKGVSIGIDFKTNDESIWAAGPCTSYDNKLVASTYDHPFYNSYEVGQLLGDKMIREMDPTKRQYVLTKTGPQKPLIPPKLTQPLVHYAELPGGWHYMYCRKPGPMPKCCGDECTCIRCECGTEITTGSTDRKVDRSQKHFRLWLNQQFKVEGFECLSRKRFSPWNLSSIFGAHESLLHNLVERSDRGEIQCLFSFFEQPWMGALCMDRWKDFKLELSHMYQTYQIDDESTLLDFVRAYLDNLENPEALKVDANIIRRIFDTSGLKQKIELKFLDFLRYNRRVIPMYARPDFVEKLIEERRLSPLMIAPNIEPVGD